MDITYLGHSSFAFKGAKARVVVDPFDTTLLGMPFPKTEADIVTVSHQHDDHNAISHITGNPLLLELPGEYEKNGVRVYGFETFHDKNNGEERGKNILFKFEIDGISILHCGDLGHALTNELIQEINGADILLVPVGGVYTINADEARQVVERLEPSIVIPMHFRDPSLTTKIADYDSMATVDEFLQKIGVTDIQPVKKLSVKSSDFGEEDMRIVVMER